MSIANTLVKAAKLQEKIDGLRGQLAGILDKARAELASIPAEILPTAVRRAGRPKMLKSSTLKSHNGNGKGHGRGRPGASVKVDGRTKAARAVKNGRRSPLAGRKRSSSPSGPLAPAVVKVLESKGKAMNVRDILSDLISGGYKFNATEPKKNLAARIYRLNGVKQVGPGLFNLV